MILTLTRWFVPQLCERILVLELLADHLLGLWDRVTDLRVVRSLHGMGLRASLHAAHKIVDKVCMLVHGGKSVSSVLLSCSDVGG